MGVAPVRPMRAASRRVRIGGALEPIGGVVIVSSAFLPWVAHGLGSSVDLHDLGDLLLGGTVSAVVPRWVGLAAYLIPIVGATLIVTSAVEGRRARGATTALVALLVVLIGVAIVVPFVRHARPSTGQAVAGMGAVLAALGVACRRRATPEPER